MSKRSRRNHSSAFKAKVAIATIKGDHTLAELVKQFDVHPNCITKWKQLLLVGANENETGRANEKGTTRITLI